MTYPAWDKMTDEQKLSYLREWCERLSRGVEEQRAVSQNLHERLLMVEAKVVGTS
jgi:hypothetical protein